MFSLGETHLSMTDNKPVENNGPQTGRKGWAQRDDLSVPRLIADVFISSPWYLGHQGDDDIAVFLYCSNKVWPAGEIN